MPFVRVLRDQLLKLILVHCAVLAEWNLDVAPRTQVCVRAGPSPTTIGRRWSGPVSF